MTKLKYPLLKTTCQSLIFSLMLITSSSKAFSKTYKSSDVDKIKNLITKLKRRKIPYKFSKSKESKLQYQLLLKDYKRYRNLKIRRDGRTIYKNQLFYLQFRSPNLKTVQNVKKVFINKGFKAKHLVILRKKSPITVFKIKTLKKRPKAQQNPLALFDLRMAQTRIRVEYGAGGSEDRFSNTYGNLLTGIELSHPSYLIKTLGRVEYYKEDYQEEVYELDETYLTTQIGNAQLTLGKQLFSWGTFDEFSTFDRVNIKNTQRFVFDSGENFRRPITAARLEMYSGSFKLDTFIDFGLESGRKIVRNSRFGYFNPETGEIRGADPDLVPPTLIKNTTTHFDGREKISYGARLSYSSNFDFSLNFLKAHNDFPMAKVSDELRAEVLSNSITPVGLNAGINMQYFQEEVIGVDFAKTIAGQLYKFEVAYIQNSPTLDSSLKIQEFNKSRLSLGGDFELDSLATTLTWQIVNQTVLTSEEILMNKEMNQVILQSSTDTMLDKGRYGLRIIANTSDSSAYASPFFDYDYNDNLTLGLNYHYFTGEDYSFFGSNKEDNFINFKMRLLF